MPQYRIGILAYGSLIDDPGPEISPHIIHRIQTLTPFNVEFKRKSSTRGSAPTLIPVSEGGRRVKAVLLVLNEVITLDDARTWLWRRERHKYDPNETYNEPPIENNNSVRVRIISNLCNVNTVLYTEISQNIQEPVTAELLAELAIGSILSNAGEECKDGIRYLLSTKSNGIVTDLSKDYEDQILVRTGVNTLEEAITILDRKRKAM